MKKKYLIFGLSYEHLGIWLLWVSYTFKSHLLFSKSNAFTFFFSLSLLHLLESQGKSRIEVERVDILATFPVLEVNNSALNKLDISLWFCFKSLFIKLEQSILFSIFWDISSQMCVEFCKVHLLRWYYVFCSLF